VHISCLALHIYYLSSALKSLAAVVGSSGRASVKGRGWACRGWAGVSGIPPGQQLASKSLALHCFDKHN